MFCGIGNSGDIDADSRITGLVARISKVRLLLNLSIFSRCAGCSKGSGRIGFTIYVNRYGWGGYDFMDLENTRQIGRMQFLIMRNFPGKRVLFCL